MRDLPGVSPDVARVQEVRDRVRSLELSLAKMQAVYERDCAEVRAKFGTDNPGELAKMAADAKRDADAAWQDFQQAEKDFTAKYQGVA